MRFGLVHRVMTGALAVLGMLSLATSGELDRTVGAVLGVGLVVAMLIPERIQAHPRMRILGVLGSMGLLVSHSVRLFIGHDPLTVAVEFAAALQIVRVATRRGGAHDQQIVLLALLHLVAGTVIGGGLAYGLCFFGFLVAAPGALVLSHLRREVEGNYRQGARDRTGLPVDVPRILRSRRVISGRFLLATCSLAIPIFVFTAVLFIAFPRVGLSLLFLNHQRSGRMVGFSDRVDLGKVGRLRSDPTIALRVYLPDVHDESPVRVPLYLRGTAFDTYDGRSWSRDRTTQPAPQAGPFTWVQNPRVGLGPELMTIDLEPIKPPIVFLPTGGIGFEVISRSERTTGRELDVLIGREGEFEYSSMEERGIRYRVLGAARPGVASMSAREARRYLTLPTNVPERVGALAKQWVGEAESPRQIATLIEHRLRTEYAYDLQSPSGAAANPLDDFLFESKRGHCEYYSTSMAIMLRTLGIPSRNVTGFIGGTLNRFGLFYAVRQGDAHSWVEAYIDGLGWTRFDPTPAGDSAPRAEITGVLAFLRDVVEAAGERWDRHVIGYDLRQQVGLLRQVGKQWRRAKDGRAWMRGHRNVLLGLAWTAVVMGLVYFWWRRRKQSGGPGERKSVERAEEATQAAALYRRLEDVMRQRGVPRRLETPPLAHARALSALGHPISDEVLALTEVYLSVRFGGKPLTSDGIVGFKRRLSALKKLDGPSEPVGAAQST